MQCPSCGAEVNATSTFCNHCGAKLGVAAAAGAPPPPPYAAAPPAAGLSDNAAGAIAYLTIIPAIIFLLLEPYNRRPFVRFHSYQCIAFGVVTLVIHLVLGVIPILGWIVSVFVSLAFFVIWLITIFKASRGEWFKLPIIGDFAEQQAKRP
jgi:uncharacterized membrane protein